jgi:hypothetical protein
MGVFGLVVPRRAPPGNERAEDPLFRVGGSAVATVPTQSTEARDAPTGR